ncbi:MAG: hypothetical protein GX453_10650 [Lactococcus chungangensis]|uniref:Uncharacterized protein n=1 Tax=Pseudolactococcus chungangensis TaxID=451457 RepID=A0A847J3W9_9LACT|nr:hypothetical protein [Bacilli bacterium]NLH36455.1 hypothetical protein [Lactococcus chungangensis]
MTPIEYRETCL